MRTVRHIMEPRVHWLADDAPLGRVAELLAQEQISGAPVCDRDGRVVGVISKTDLTEHYGDVHENRTASDVMTSHVLSVRPDDPIETAIRLMAFEGVHRLLVIDEKNQLVGILTSMDVLRELAGFPRQEPRVEAVAPPEER